MCIRAGAGGPTAALTAVLTAVLTVVALAPPSVAAVSDQPPAGAATAFAATYSVCDEDGDDESLTRTGVLGTDQTVARARRTLAVDDPASGQRVAELTTSSRLRVESRARDGAFSRIDLRAHTVARGRRDDVESECTAFATSSTRFEAPIALERVRTVVVTWSVDGPRELELGIYDDGRDAVVTGGGATRRGQVVVRLARGRYELIAGYRIGVDVDEQPGRVEQAGSVDISVRVGRR